MAHSHEKQICSDFNARMKRRKTPYFVPRERWKEIYSPYARPDTKTHPQNVKFSFHEKQIKFKSWANDIAIKSKQGAR